LNLYFSTAGAVEIRIDPPMICGKVPAMSENLPEPWLRGPIAGVHPLVMPVFFTFALVREELSKHTDGLTDAQVWTKPANTTASLGFHLKHMAGTVDRLTTYLVGRQLSQAQLETLRHESEAHAGLDALLRLVNESLEAAEEQLRKIDPDSLYAPRVVGRRALPTTVLGLIVHIAEHTQRHLGQAVITAKLVRVLNPDS
jgi:uncharacterized damage-inducible protein DinB